MLLEPAVDSLLRSQRRCRTSWRFFFVALLLLALGEVVPSVAAGDSA
jgi:hypothetical protein